MRSMYLIPIRGGSSDATSTTPRLAWESLVRLQEQARTSYFVLWATKSEGDKY